jgi:hypothetical protein
MQTRTFIRILIPASFITGLLFARTLTTLRAHLLQPGSLQGKTLEIVQGISQGLGPKYIPPPENLSSSEVKLHLLKFIRSIKIAYHFKTTQITDVAQLLKA